MRTARSCGPISRARPMAGVTTTSATSPDELDSRLAPLDSVRVCAASRALRSRRPCGLLLLIAVGSLSAIVGVMHAERQLAVKPDSDGMTNRGAPLVKAHRAPLSPAIDRGADQRQARKAASRRRPRRTSNRERASHAAHTRESRRVVDERARSSRRGTGGPREGEVAARPRLWPRLVPPAGPRDSTSPQPIAICREVRRVSDGIRTRDRRDHNPEPRRNWQAPAWRLPIPQYVMLLIASGHVSIATQVGPGARPRARAQH